MDSLLLWICSGRQHVGYAELQVEKKEKEKGEVIHEKLKEEEKQEEKQEEQKVSENTKEFRKMLNRFTCCRDKFFEDIDFIRNLAHKMNLNSINKTEFERIYDEIMDSQIDISKNTKLELQLNQSKSRELFTKISMFVLPKFKEIVINGLSYVDDKVVNDFLSHSIPVCLESLKINFCSPQIQCSTYFEGIKMALSQVKYSFIISNALLQNDEFVEIISAAAHLMYINFWNCEIYTDSYCDFSKIKRSNLHDLYIFNSNKAEFIDCKEHRKRLLNIFKGIKSCPSLKESIKLIHVSNCGITENEINKILMEYDLSHITVFGCEK